VLEAAERFEQMAAAAIPGIVTGLAPSYWKIRHRVKIPRGRRSSGSAAGASAVVIAAGSGAADTSENEGAVAGLAALFAGADTGGERAAALYTIMQTAKAQRRQSGSLSARRWLRSPMGTRSTASTI
jgi:hypothetical protein